MLRCTGLPLAATRVDWEPMTGIGHQLAQTNVMPVYAGQPVLQAASRPGRQSTRSVGLVAGVDAGVAPRVPTAAR